MKKILITTGGTGGHVIPAKIIEEHLRGNFEIHFSSDERGLKFFSSETKNIIVLDTPRFNKSLYFPLKLLKLIYLILQAGIYLKKNNIEKVISIGGYMSLPVILAAKILSINIFLFEPNLVLGRGNRFFLKFSKKIFCYSNKLSLFPQQYLNKIELIKPLISKALYESKKIEKQDDKFCFLIFGGSQGAIFFDELIKEVMIEISKNFPIKIIHQTREDNIEKLREFYKANNIDSKIFSFEKDFIDLINMSDFCISRAGATSLAEISFLNKPFIAIPLPTSMDDHQKKNAQFYEEMGCCWVLDQKDLTKEKLLNILLKILKDKSQLTLKKSNLENLNYKNSWNDINHKLQKIFNEN